jgi:hypothetical protein
MIAGEIHLQPFAELHSGPESPTDMLNREERFFAVSLDSGAPLLLAKAHVVFLKLTAQPLMADPDRASAAKSMEMGIELATGLVIHGTITAELPPERARPIDFLNVALAFFILWSPDAVYLINRAHVRAVSPM